MSNYIKYFLIFLLSMQLISCVSTKYIHDSESKIRLQEFRKTRSENVFWNLGFGVLSTFLAITINVAPAYQISNSQFKKICLENPSTDTLYVNMLTNVHFNDSLYCDFRDIRIPPLKKYRILAPLNADYNLYHRPTFESDNDQKIEFNTSKRRKIILINEIQTDTINH